MRALGGLYAGEAASLLHRSSGADKRRKTKADTMEGSP